MVFCLFGKHLLVNMGDQIALLEKVHIWTNLKKKLEKLEKMWEKVKARFTHETCLYKQRSR
jgi:hypothetical protein